MPIHFPVILNCGQCGTQLAPTLLACPACGRLVHGERLRALAADAEDAARRGDATAALARWREALDLLPAGSRQLEVVTEKVNALSEQVRTGAAGSVIPLPYSATTRAPETTRKHTGARGALIGAGALALLLWKFKFVVVFLVTKGKLLILGLTKSTTILSMLLSLGVYWTAWGWKFALGFVLSIYVHEMGHVVALTRYGFKATAPMFIPGIGALIRLKQHPANPHEDAAIGLAGPVYGLGAALAALGLWYATDHPVFAAIAWWGALINLFNLLPVGSLDGGRAFRALSRNQRWLAVLAIGAAWFYTEMALLPALLVMALIRAIPFRASRDSPAEVSDARATALYVGLVWALSLICMIRVPLGDAGASPGSDVQPQRVGHQLREVAGLDGHPLAVA